eukprot:6675334-Prymnesium_polylepis.1
MMPTRQRNRPTTLNIVSWSPRMSTLETTVSSSLKAPATDSVRPDESCTTLSSARMSKKPRSAPTEARAESASTAGSPLISARQVLSPLHSRYSAIGSSTAHANGEKAYTSASGCSPCASCEAVPSVSAPFAGVVPVLRSDCSSTWVHAQRKPAQRLAHRTSSSPTIREPSVTWAAVVLHSPAAATASRSTSSSSTSPSSTPSSLRVLDPPWRHRRAELLRQPEASPAAASPAARGAPLSLARAARLRAALLETAAAASAVAFVPFRAIGAACP